MAWPPVRKISAGSAWTPKRVASFGSASTLIFTTVAWPVISFAGSSIIGAIAWQGPHQGAQKSSKTGSGRPASASSKVAVVR
jgi:hypothetical protein